MQLQNAVNFRAGKARTQLMAVVASALFYAAAPAQAQFEPVVFHRAHVRSITGVPQVDGIAVGCVCLTGTNAAGQATTNFVAVANSQYFGGYVVVAPTAKGITQLKVGQLLAQLENAADAAESGAEQPVETAFVGNFGSDRVRYVFPSMQLSARTTFTQQTWQTSTACKGGSTCGGGTLVYNVSGSCPRRSCGGSSSCGGAPACSSFSAPPPPRGVPFPRGVGIVRSGGRPGAAGSIRRL